MAPLKSTLLALTTLLTSTLAYPTLSNLPRLDSRALGDGTNYSISAGSTNTAVNKLTFGVFTAQGSAAPGAYLYDHGSIPLNYGSAYNLGANTDATILSAAYDPSVQVELREDGHFLVGADGTPGFWVPEGTTHLAFNIDSEVRQDVYAACPYSGPKPSGTDVRYTVQYVVQPDGVAPEGCELINLEVDG